MSAHGRGSQVVDNALVFEALTALQRSAARTVAEALAEDGFTVDQWRLMRALSDGAGHRLGELAADLVIPLASMTRLVDGLAELGLVYRRPSPRDGRSVDLHLSRQGAQTVGRLDALAEARLAALTDEPAWRALRDVHAVEA